MKKKKKNNKNIVEIQRRDWNVDYVYDMITGNGFEITEPPEISLDGSKETPMYGAQSPLYGASYSDENSYIKRYRCKCGEFQSKQFEGEICPICHTPVEAKGVDVKFTGWINLGETNRVINPLYFNLLSSAIGKKIFRDIIKAQFKINKDGKKEPVYPEDLETPPSSIYHGIGIDGFYEKYYEILKYFKNVKKNKQSQIEALMDQKHKVFITKIPVYSTMLRPQSITSDSYYFKSIDKIINTLFTLSETIKQSQPINRDFILERIQLKLNKMWEFNFDLINGKDGFLRDQILGGSLDYTSRNVITLDTTLRINQVDLSYHTFLVLFKYLILSDLMKLEDISLSKAFYKWNMACIKFDETIYECMLHLLETKHLKVIINRNPTLNFYSILLMDIRTVKKDFNDFTLSLPSAILPGLNADFDGDILNIIGLIDKRFNEIFKEFNPTKNMIIAPDNGKLNKLIMITKSDLVNIYTFLNYEGSENDRPEKYPGEKGYIDPLSGKIL